MVSDTRQAFKAAFKTLLETVSGIDEVSLIAKPIDQYTTDDFPLARIDEKEAVSTHFLTSAEVNLIRFEIILAVKADVSDDVLSGYSEAMTDAITTNPQVSDTCDYCLSEGQYTPDEWGDSNYKVRILIYRVMLRRSTA